MAQPKLRIIPLGGLGEIGKNMTVFELGNDAIILDTGVMFPTHDMHGVDYIIPDFSYLQQRTDLKIHGILYTHGHEDHTGAVTHVVEAFPGVPLYATRLTTGLLEVKLREGRLLDKTTIHTIAAGDTLSVGPFTAEAFHVCHSIPDCVGFAIETPFGLIVHTGDYKFDNTPVDGRRMDYARLASYSQRGVLLLMGDSTNADRPGWTPSEAVISGGFDRVFAAAQGRIVVATFASLISRVQQVVDAARKHKRKIAFAGHSMVRNVDMAIALGILKVPDNMIVDLGQVNHLPDNQVVIMATGSQGEPSSVLTRMASGRYRVEVQRGDTIVLSAHPIPGNEEGVYRIINSLFRRGANVIYDPLEAVHVSGHGFQEDMRLMLNLTRPQYMLPVHGELRHLYEHANLAVQSGVAPDNVYVMENGMVLEVDANGVRRTGERVPGTYVYVDGNGVGDIGRAVLKDRDNLARDGFFVVITNVDRKARRVVGTPEIISRGFVYLRDADQLMRNVEGAVEQVVGSANGSSPQELRTRIEDSVSRLLYNETRRRPMVFSVVNEL